MAEKPEPQPAFEDALGRVEKIVEELESGDLTLDASLARYEHGVQALKQCYDMLRAAEKKVEILLQGEGEEAQTAPFESAPGTDAGTTP